MHCVNGLDEELTQYLAWEEAVGSKGPLIESAVLGCLGGSCHTFHVTYMAVVHV